jgi:hypothetical protein
MDTDGKGVPKRRPRAGWMAMNTKMSVVLRPEQIEKLKAFAAERDLSMSDVVREIVRGYAAETTAAEKPKKRTKKGRR